MESQELVDFEGKYSKINGYICAISKKFGSMKKSLLVVLCACLMVGTSFAQDVESIDPVTTVMGSLSNPDDAELDVHWDLVNMGSDTLKVRLRRIQDQIVSGSQNRFCWGPLCYDYPTNESSSNPNLLVTMAPGVAETTFHGYYEHQGNAGHSVIQYCFFDAFDTSNESCTSVNFCVDDACVVGVDEMTNAFELGNISPNPVTGLASFSYSFQQRPSNARVSIYNLVGKSVRQVALNNKNGIVFLDAQDYQAGVYFYTLEVNGKILSTKKLVISK